MITRFYDLVIKNRKPGKSHAIDWMILINCRFYYQIHFNIFDNNLQVEGNIIDCYGQQEAELN